MKFLIVADSHIRGSSPKSRRDGFFETVIKKLSEVMAVAKENHVDAILHAGDLFDRPDVSPSVVREIASVLKSSPAPIYMVAGNHDIFGQNPDTLNRTMLGLMDSFGIICLLPQNQEIVFLKDLDTCVQLTGTHFHHQLDRRDPSMDYCVKKDPRSDIAIHLVHGMLLEKPFFPGIAHTLIDQITHTDADITICGHYHFGFDPRRNGIVKIDSKYFVNPGAMVRINNSLTEMERTPQMLLLTINRKQITWESHIFQSAQPGVVVLDREVLIQTQYRENQLAEFTREIQATSDFRLWGVPQIITAIADAIDIPEQVRQEAIRRIGLAEHTIISGEQDSDI
jgi:DNA repair exonuclease SbcCD nuclease subunit